ncbi:PREDICTED: uncharacterized protein LOC106813865 [Priapulus caudatus]|uniref:Uncharacterized protein LOC106813865 n=1 Tax=Priapulus caudatus TaxID=37621 RepID=A0ABM1EN20_PRICU|nr:PREDICTED: uncharacterized protein LOC106813865 [Priapulus caudatus]
MAPPTNSNKCSSDSFIQSSLTKKILFSYIPLAGAASYQAFSLNVVNPKFLKSVFPNWHFGVTNALLLNAHLGVGLYLFSRPHMACSTHAMCPRVAYSVFGAVMFNFGSVLLWATAKTVVPPCTTARALFALGSGAGLLWVGYRYVKMLDENATRDV